MQTSLRGLSFIIVLTNGNHITLPEVVADIVESSLMVEAAAMGIAKISFMAKNVFRVLNNDNVWWFSIMASKYGDFKIWSNIIPAKCSWFYRGLYYNAFHIRPFLWMNTINPNLTSFLQDPWYFEIPIACKPTYLNMNLDIERVLISDLVEANHWKFNLLQTLFGPIINDDIISQSIISYDLKNNWLWFPKTESTKLTAMIYAHFNQNNFEQNYWEGWRNVWHLKVAPRVKHFCWILLYNAVKTHEYLYRLNLGPQTFCSFCNLYTESTDHLFRTCSKTQVIWNMVGTIIKRYINLTDEIFSGHWILQGFSGNDTHTQSVIAATIWFIWKARCNRIFRDEGLDYHIIASRAIGHVREYSCTNSFQVRKYFIGDNFTFSDSPIILIASVYNLDGLIAGLGFITVDSFSNFIFAGSCGSPADSSFVADVRAFCFTL
ncbi:Reverse transcriptase zinc-binding domain-containing protein [Dioscorea alata]|uniref:Reverse transcriptase zinc-binding domain-containing protein n=1 Tax=Dioscorea alata TaxID=55571 RepID=A0ACB7VWL7_DIOAL|nr:Reverse transcriptase zinc-binding domain-containing protein [Dioscorea alata]